MVGFAIRQVTATPRERVWACHFTHGRHWRVLSAMSWILTNPDGSMGSPSSDVICNTQARSGSACVCVCVCVRVCMCAPVCVCVCVLLSTIGLTSGWRRCSKKSKRWSVVLSVVLNSIKGTVAVRLVQQLNFNNLNNVNKQHKQQLKQVKQTTKILTAVGTQRSLTCCRRAGGQP